MIDRAVLRDPCRVDQFGERHHAPVGRVQRHRGQLGQARTRPALHAQDDRHGLPPSLGVQHSHVGAGAQHVETLRDHLRGDPGLGGPLQVNAEVDPVLRILDKPVDVGDTLRGLEDSLYLGRHLRLPFQVGAIDFGHHGGEARAAPPRP